MLEKLLLSNDELIPGETDYAELSKALLIQQKATWEQLSSGYNSLNTVQTKTFEFDGFTIKIQFNPGRIISSSARVDSESIKNRKCFLCYTNLPERQKGILYGSNYLILSNPYPIFTEHFTLPHIDHIPQEITSSFQQLLSFSKDLSKHYTVFYNGPKCGASAPDHLHFQAGNKFFMPVDNEYEHLINNFSDTLFEGDFTKVNAIDDGLRKFISVESKSRNEIEIVFEELYSQLIAINEDNEEPLLNVLGFYNEGLWRVLFILRQKHRPSHYFAEGDDNILLSPASVDLGGVCITPLEKDFNKITKDNIVEIFKEVSLPKEQFVYVSKGLKKNLAI